MKTFPEAARLADLVNDLTLELQQHGVDEAKLKAELLVSRVAGIRRLALFIDPDRVLSLPQRKKLGQYVEQLIRGEPIQYVLGETEFMGHTFKTDARALIPRPETEQLVEAVLACSALWSGKKPAIVDVGTGSGCIAISLALAQQEATYLAVEVSEDALKLARENAERLNVANRISFLRSDLLKSVPSDSHDAVVSNPPYIASGAMKDLASHIRDHEPVLALDGGADGLDAIRRLAAEAFQALRIGGRLFMEIGSEQGDDVRDILDDAGYREIDILRDLAALPRIAKASKP